MSEQQTLVYFALKGQIARDNERDRGTFPKNKGKPLVTRGKKSKIASRVSANTANTKSFP
jgi:hypothetical protein